MSLIRNPRVVTAAMFAIVTAPQLSDAHAAETRVRVDDAWARRAPMLDMGSGKGGSGNGAVYATLQNPGRETDALIAATSDVARGVEIHESYEASGMMRMREVPKIDVPPGQKVEMKPGGYHIMLINLTRELKPGDAIDLTLRFEKAGAVPVTARIR